MNHRPNPKPKSPEPTFAASPDSGLADELADELLEGTRLESAEEIRRVAGAKRAPTAKEQVPVSDTPAFYPTQRPPVAQLCILDDGADDGEWVRLRSGRCVIGREQGDIIIPHDSLMSGRHAEIVRQINAGRYCWQLTDLGSTNGSFVRVSRIVLKHGQEVFLGSGRYSFQCALTDPTSTAAGSDAAPQGTRGWQKMSASGLAPALVEVTPGREGQRHLLAKPDNWIGRDPRRCTIVLANDPFADAALARVFRDKENRWVLENNSSVNGIWARLRRVILPETAQFMLGEQRFLFRCSDHET
jgi:pSer/pThr/pTyr-binding forkhead associated (FHA) protein